MYPKLMLHVEIIKIEEYVKKIAIEWNYTIQKLEFMLMFVVCL